MSPPDGSSAAFHGWLRDQADRLDYTGDVARLVLRSPCCTDGPDELILHMMTRHRGRDAVAAMRARAEWRADAPPSPGADVVDIAQRRLRPWLATQAHRRDDVGEIARLILTSACCTGADFPSLHVHLVAEHGDQPALALVQAAREWRTQAHPHWS